MKKEVVQIVRRLTPRTLLEAARHVLDPDGPRGIAKRGHRGYVGGMWEEIGQLQFDFLLSQGLKPHSYLLDIACGSLRLGVKVIPYLEPSHYLGVEKESELVKEGLEKELDPNIRIEKRPNIIISKSFEFERLNHKADFAISQSLFTHIPSSLITLCFKKLHPWLEDDGSFYATFFRTERKVKNPTWSYDHGYFAYTQAEMREFGEKNGYVYKYIGDWNHPQNQVIVEYTKE